jgi:hypothetical protein
VRGGWLACRLIGVRGGYTSRGGHRRAISTYRATPAPPGNSGTLGRSASDGDGSIGLYSAPPRSRGPLYRWAIRRPAGPSILRCNVGRGNDQNGGNGRIAGRCAAGIARRVANRALAGWVAWGANKNPAGWLIPPGLAFGFLVSCRLYGEPTRLTQRCLHNLVTQRVVKRARWKILRKEVIQPQVPLRLPCYDLVPIAEFTFGACLPCGLARRLRMPPTFVA